MNRAQAGKVLPLRSTMRLPYTFERLPRRSLTPPSIWKFWFRTISLSQPGAALLNTAQSPPSTTLSPLSTRGRWWTQVKGMKNVLQRYLGAGILSSEYVHFLISGSSAKGSSRFCAENAANEAWPGNQGSSVRNISTGGLRRWILFWGRMSKAQDDTT